MGAVSLKITTNKVLFIKLGGQGKWESECIEKTNTLKLGFNESDFQACLKGDWDKVKDDYLKSSNNKSLATRTVNQIKSFFEEPEDTIWITFFKDKLWWTKAKARQITEVENGDKIRPCLSKWSDKDIEGTTLDLDKISGKLSKTQGFRGTICQIHEKDYFLRKVNAEESEDVKATHNSYESLKENLCKLIKKLTWQDFELLTDLIFTHAGWKRVSVLGKNKKTIDLKLESPVTNEICAVQVKSRSDNNQLSDYLEESQSMDQCNKIFYVCHSFKGTPQQINDDRVQLLLKDEIAKLAIDSGLSQWIISKVS